MIAAVTAVAIRAGAYLLSLQQRGPQVLDMPADVQERVRDLGGLRSTDEELLSDAYRRSPVNFVRALGSAASARNGSAYLAASARGICAEDMARKLPAVPQRRHDLDPVVCNDCADTGFVVLTRDLGPEARAGDAAPCHCDTGQAKQKRFGMINYTRDDYDPAVPLSVHRPNHLHAVLSTQKTDESVSL